MHVSRARYSMRLTAACMAAALTLTGLASSLAVASPAFTGLGTLPGLITSRAYAVSSDGSTVAGAGFQPNGGQVGFRWTAANGLEPVLSGLPQTTIAYGLSGNGQVIGGYTESIIDAKAYVWTEGVGPTLLFARGTLWAGSADGSVFAGDQMDGGTHQHHAVRWSTANGVRSIEPQGVVLGFSRALGVDATGTKLVGEAVFPNFATTRAFVWDAVNGMVNIGSPNIAEGSSRADAISADGSTVVGMRVPGSASYSVAFRWTAAGGMQLLDDLFANVSSEAFGVSADGSTIVGSRNGEAVLWRAGLGLIPVRGALGAAAQTWRLVEARGVSADGTVIVGWGYNPQGQIEAWRAEVPLELAAVGPATPARGALDVRAYPNPAPGAVFVRASAGAAGVPSSAAVLDLAGRVVRTLGDGAANGGGTTWSWDGRADDGRAVAAGVYLARVRVGNETRTARIMRVR